jgi:hypothetical protein
MRVSMKYLLSTFAAIILVAAVVLLSSHTSRAQLSAPTLQAITAQFFVGLEDQGRNAYQSTLNKGSTNGVTPGPCTGLTGCSFLFPAVPTGHRVVVQHISGLLQFSGPDQVRVVAQIGATTLAGFTAQADHDGLVVIDEPTLFYVNAGQRPTVSVQAVGASVTLPVLGTDQVTVIGSSLDCTIAPCLTIAK